MLTSGQASAQQTYGQPRTHQETAQEPMNLQIEAGITGDDNVTRAWAAPDRLRDESVSVIARKSFEHALSEQSRVLVTGSLGGEKFRRYNGLSRLAGSVQGEYQYRDSSEFAAPTFGAIGTLAAEEFDSALRDGFRLSVGVSVRQALTDRIDVFAALSHMRRFASSDVFSTRDNSARMNLDYALGPSGTLYLGAEYRRGDIVSSTRQWVGNAAIAKGRVADDAFAGGQWFAYRLDGGTALATVGANLGLGPSHSLDFSWTYIRSTPARQPGWATSVGSYKVNQVSAVYLMRF